jgi:hypothetical protein
VVGKKLLLGGISKKGINGRKGGKIVGQESGEKDEENSGFLDDLLEGFVSCG